VAKAGPGEASSASGRLDQRGRRPARDHRPAATARPHARRPRAAAAPPPARRSLYQRYGTWFRAQELAPPRNSGPTSGGPDHTLGLRHRPVVRLPSQRVEQAPSITGLELLLRRVPTGLRQIVVPGRRRLIAVDRGPRVSAYAGGAKHAPRPRVDVHRPASRNSNSRSSSGHPGRSARIRRHQVAAQLHSDAGASSCVRPPDFGAPPRFPVPFPRIGRSQVTGYHRTGHARVVVQRSRIAVRLFSGLLGPYNRP